MPEHKLFPFAFSWGFENLAQICDTLKSERNQIRADLGIPADSFTILYCGRLSPEKSPLYAIQAFERVEQPNKVLIMVGDGDLRQSLEEYVARKEIESVHFFGFQNRQEIPKYYAASDALVLPSDQETWGIVVNEAMCFGLPLLVSDQVGAARDLVRHGYNGFTFPRGDVEELARDIRQLMDLSPEERLTMQERSRDLIEKWSDRNLTDCLDQYFDLIYSDK